MPISGAMMPTAGHGIVHGGSSAADRSAQQAARAFEALVFEQMLNAAGAARLGDDLLGDRGDQVRQLANRLRADLLAAAAPLDMARQLETRR